MSCTKIEPFKILEKSGFSIINNPFGRKLTEAEVIEIASDCVGIIAGVEPLTVKVMDALTDLKCISRVGVGMDSVDLEHAKKNGIIVVNTPDGPTRSVAEMSIALTFSLLRKIPQADANIKKAKQSGCTYILHTKDIGASRRIYIGMDDEHIKAIKAIQWAHKLKGRRIRNLLDIGANIGHICIPLVKHDTIKRAIAYEPDPENFKLLKCNIALNSMESKIAIDNLALGSLLDETLEFELSKDNLGDHRIRVSNEKGIYHETLRQIIHVQSTSLDSVFPNDIDPETVLIWIDVQGYEGAVLAGASLLLKRKPAIGLEFWPYGLHRASGMQKLLVALKPYNVFYNLSFDKPTPQPISILADLFSKNRQNDNYMMDILIV